MLVVALNYAPELTGIGKYVGELTSYMAKQDVAVRVVTAPPYYPSWRIQEGYSGRAYRKERLCGVDVYRCPLWVPRAPSGLKRILHQLTFALSSLPVLLWLAITWRPQIVFVVQPPLGCVPGARIAAKLCGARTWLHVQDFEVDAAFDLGILRSNWLKKGLLAAERRLMSGFDRVSSISERMLAKLGRKGVEQEQIVLFPNWVDTRQIQPLESTASLREELGIAPGTRVLLYSGNMGEKQGLETIVQMARDFTAQPDVLFLFCGDGAARPRIQQSAQGLPNVRFIPLQPVTRLNELLNLATLHLLPQRAEAEDLVMPSKLSAIMASGRPVVASARLGSDVARAAREGGVVVPPGDDAGFAKAIHDLLADELMRLGLGTAGRAYATMHWDRSTVLRRMLGEFGYRRAVDREALEAAIARDADTRTAGQQAA